MNELPTIFEAVWADRIGWTLVHSVWQVGIIAAIYAVASLVLRRHSANVRYLLGCVALAAMVAAPAATLMRMSPSASVANSPAVSPTPIQLSHIPMPAGAVPRAIDPPPSAVTAPQPSFVLPPIKSHPVWTVVVGGMTLWRERMERVLPWLATCWLVGVMVLAMRPLWGLAVVRRLKTRGLTPLSTELRQLAGRMMIRLRVNATVRFAESALVKVPTVVGYVRPMVLLPASAVTGLSTEQLELILAHELAHVRRHDYLVNLLQTALEALLFYHPGMWWVSARVRRERENCCDDVAMSVCCDRGQYIRALYTLESHRRSAVPALAASGGSLVRRIRRLLPGSETHACAHSPREWLAGLLTLAVVITLLAIGQITAQSNSEASQEVEPRSSVEPNRMEDPRDEPKPIASNAGESADTKPNVNKPWIAMGRVMDAGGDPISGAEVKAFSGVGTLFKTGSATTDIRGNYRFEFGPGVRFERGSDQLQAATISASKAGYFERNLNRQGDLVAGYSPSAETMKQRGVTPNQVFRTGIPQSVDFVMLPAAVLEGEFVETSHDWSVREQSFYLTGDELPPSSSALTSVTTDRKGRFRVDAIPTGRKWRIGMRVPNTGVDIETEPFEFAEPGVYRGKLLLETTSGDGSVKMSLRFVDLEQVATVAEVRSIDQLDGEGFSQLHRAASGGHVERVRELLATGANVDVQQGTYHGTPLQYAASSGHGETVQALVDHHATIDSKDAAGRTPLLWAATSGHADVVRRLLDAGANIDVAAKGGWTALHYAVDRGHVKTAQLLIDRGADIHAKNSQGTTPFALNPKLDLRIPWRALQTARELPDYIPSTRSPAAASPRTDSRPPEETPETPEPRRPARFGGQVMGSVQNRPILWRDLAPSPEWLAQQAEYKGKHGHTLDFESPDDYALRRLQERIVKPLLEAYKKEHDLEPTEKEIEDFLTHFRQAKIDRKQEAAADLVRRKLLLEKERARLDSPKLSPQDRKSLAQSIARKESQIEELEKLPASVVPEMGAEQERFFAKWYLGNWKLQQSLYKKYGGRAIFQQAGPEAIDAMRDFLKQKERERFFLINDPALRDRFWEYFVNDRLHVFIRDPDRVFEHPWSPIEEASDRMR